MTMGWYSAGGDNIIQEFALITNGELMCSPAYWNGMALLHSGWLADAGFSGFKRAMDSVGPNGQTFEWRILARHFRQWQHQRDRMGRSAVRSTPTMLFLSNSSMLPPLTCPSVAHFATPTVANGKVYVATQTTLEAYGLAECPEHCRG